MAKKAAKKEASAAKTKKAVAKPKAKAPAKAAKPAAKEVKAKAKAPAVKPEKVTKAAKAAPAKAPKSEKAPKIEKTVEVVAEEPAATKKEKKIKIDKTGLSEDQVKWHELHEKYKAIKAPAYSISGQFEAKTPLQHKIFGWGYILSNEYDRLEVLFEDGKRMLISNRKLS